MRCSTALAALCAALVLVLASSADAIRFSVRAGRDGPRPAGVRPTQLEARLARKLQQLPKSAVGQIFLDGVLEKAGLDPICGDGGVCGGWLVVQGINVTIPKNLIVMLPAWSGGWGDLFNPDNGGGVGPDGLPATNLAKADGISGLFMVSVAANRVGTTNNIIAALVDIGQSPIIGGAGWIDSIDYVNGELIVEANNGNTGARIRINDPSGRFGRASGGLADGYDPRFGVDIDNPTVASATGFPMCIPRDDPAETPDDLCPQGNRPLGPSGIPLTAFTISTTGGMNQMAQAPFMKGDYIEYAGLLHRDGFIAAYEIGNNVAIYTPRGVDPAYVNFEAAIIGTGGLNVIGGGEAAIRSRWEGFSTDWSRPVHLYGLDFDPANPGAFTKRDYGMVMPDPGPPNGAVQGRWRFRPPCTVTGNLTVGSPYLGNKGCTTPPGGVYTPPTREVMIEIEGCVPVVGAGNGIGGCSYRNPAIEYIWPENVPGSPIVENNFNSVPFLAEGGYVAATGTSSATLEPWPSNVLPLNACVPPTINLGAGTFSAYQGSYVTLDADVTPLADVGSYVWTQDNSNGGSCGAAALDFKSTGRFTSSCGPLTAATTYTLSIFMDKCPGQKFTKVANVKIVAVPQAIINSISTQTVKSGTSNVKIPAITKDGSAVQFRFTLPSGIVAASIINAVTGQPAAVVSPPTAPNVITLSELTSSAYITFKAPVLTVGTLTETMLSFTVVANPSSATPSDSVTGTVMVQPPSDTVNLAAVAFRCDKHRMTITATTNVNNQLHELYLMPYTDNQGKYFNPASLGVSTNLVYGLVGAVPTYTITISPVPLPSNKTASLTVASSLGGSDAHQMSVPNDVKGVCYI